MKEFFKVEGKGRPSAARRRRGVRAMLGDMLRTLKTMHWGSLKTIMMRLLCGILGRDMREELGSTLHLPDLCDAKTLLRLLSAGYNMTSMDCLSLIDSSKMIEVSFQNTAQTTILKKTKLKVHFSRSRMLLQIKPAITISAYLDPSTPRPLSFNFSLDPESSFCCTRTSSQRPFNCHHRHHH